MTETRRKVEHGRLDLSFYPHRSVFENAGNASKRGEGSAVEEDGDERNEAHCGEGRMHIVPADVFRKYRMKRDTGQGLRELWLTGQSLATLSHAVGSLLNLRTLGLAGNNLTSLPEAICRLPRLERLILSNNRIAMLPDSLAEVSSLVELRLDRNEFESIPSTVRLLRCLQRLSLSSNRISEVPAFLVGLRQLIELDLSENCLQWDAVASLRWQDMSKQLQYVSFRGNREISKVPPGLLRLERLEAVVLATRTLELGR